MSNFREKKKSLDGQIGKQTRFTNPKEYQRSYRASSPVDAEPPKPRNLPNLLTHELNDDKIDKKYITPLSARNESEREET